MKRSCVFLLVAAIMVTMSHAQTTATRSSRALLVRSQDGSAPAPEVSRGGGLFNDECAGAMELTVGASCVVVGGTYGGATESMPAAVCSGWTASAADDVWFRFTATSNSTIVQVFGSMSNDPILEVFSGSCGSLTSLGCVDGSFTGGSEILTPATVAGTVYYVRTYNWPESLPEDFSFTICVYEAPPTPVNNDCAVVTPVAVPVPGTQSFTGNSFGATDNSIGATYGFPQVWEAITIISCADVTIDLCGSPTLFDPAFIGISSGCPAAYPDNFVMSTSYLFSCSDGNVVLYFMSLPAGTYYVPVIANPGGPYLLNITTVACTPPPANDECANAIAVGNGSTPFNTLAATGTDITSCTTNDDKDIWFSYVATCTGQALVNTCGSVFDTALSAFSSCGGSELACNDDSCELQSEILFGVVAGTTYLIRVAGYNGTYGPGTLSISCDGISGIGESLSRDLTVFPNPTYGDLTILHEGKGGPALLELFDMTGRVVHTMQYTVATNDPLRLELAGRLAQGAYQLRLTMAGERMEQRIVVR
jgi:hypothetical protein